MKRSTKILSIVIIFILIIATVIIGRTMIGNHFKKKFGKRQPPGVIVTEVADHKFYEKIETFGTARDFELSSLLGWGPPRAFLLSFKYLYSGVLFEKR